jgi:iron complex outermembrane recepter protein
LREGFGSNAAGRKLNSGNDRRARLFMRYEPSGSTRLDLIAELSRSVNRPGTIAISDQTDLRDERTGSAGGNLVHPGTVRPDLAQVLEKSAFALNAPTFTKVEGQSVTARITTDFSSVRLESVTNYRRWSLEGAQDSDGNAIDPPSPPFVTGDIVNVGDNTAILKDWQFSEELQASSQGTGPLSWLAGLYYIHERNRADPVIVNNRLAGAGGGGTAAIFRAAQRANSVAGYGSVTFRPVPELGLSAGLRYTRETKSFDSALEVRQIAAFDPPGDAVFASGQVLVQAPDLDLRRSFDNASVRLVADWKPSLDWMMYASFTNGFKSGGYNAFRGIDAEFAEERIDAFEFGTKATPSRWLEMNASAFRYDYRGMQVRIPVPSGGIGIENLDRVRVLGGELEAVARPLDGWRIDLGFALLNTSIREGRLSALRDPSFVLGTAPPVIPVDVSGNRLTRAPRVQLQVATQYRLDFASHALSARIAFRHQSPVSFLETAQPSDTFMAAGSMSASMPGWRCRTRMRTGKSRCSPATSRTSGT